MCVISLCAIHLNCEGDKEMRGCLCYSYVYCNKTDKKQEMKKEIHFLLVITKTILYKYESWLLDWHLVL